MLTLFAAYSPGMIPARLAAGVAIGAVGGQRGSGGGRVKKSLALMFTFCSYLPHDDAPLP